MRVKLILLGAFLISALSFAQGKVGTVNMDLIVSKMPQSKTVIERVSKYAVRLDSSLQAKTAAYSNAIKIYDKTQESLNEEQKKEKYAELANMEKDMNNFRTNGSKLLQIQRDQLMRPIYKKINEQIIAIAKEDGYSQILTTDRNEFAYFDENFDITNKVLLKLGIQE
ncbi:OmpH family outer membrane protein [Tenacibaculum sp. SG-28]|uniref:OmpH family outer membrane protein n=1 Tax=Tenacibaculum sp. SG-28 TaxID=754426 RepID=UPI000CF54FDA|nr:OmpH family outer membrane protein [Tenacibaculum sp. SG-28]PQJ23463.1 hypothetical protein BSU00_04600 [Tenacibaculum sp. SG-28]